MEPASFQPDDTTRSPSPARDGDGANAAPTRPERNSVVPPYWQRHERHASRMSSYSSALGHRISLEDHTAEGSEQCRVLWAKGVTIDDYVVVSGTAPGLGAYVVWNCTVETLDVSLPGAACQVKPERTRPTWMPHLSLPRSQSIARVSIMRFSCRVLGRVLQKRAGIS
jgi:hypothetical protein